MSLFDLLLATSVVRATLGRPGFHSIHPHPYLGGFHRKATRFEWFSSATRLIPRLREMMIQSDTNFIPRVSFLMFLCMSARYESQETFSFEVPSARSMSRQEVV